MLKYLDKNLEFMKLDDSAFDMCDGKGDGKTQCSFSEILINP